MTACERPRAPRVEFTGETIAYLGNRQLVCDAVNLSASGMLIAERAAAGHEAPRPSRGQFVRLVFSLKASTDRFLDADAVVVRVASEQERPAWGVQFVSLPGHVSAAIGVYVGNRITESARLAGRLARQRQSSPPWRETERDVTPADLLDASGSRSFGEDSTPLRELYREALAEVEREDEGARGRPPRTRRR